MTLRHHKVTVQGTGSFPIDMLRFDGLHPETQEDVVEIESSIRDGFGSEPNPVRLTTTAAETWAPTRERWESFGWTVIDHRVGAKVS